MRTGSCTASVTSMVNKHRFNIIIRDSSYVEFQREVNDKQLVINKKKYVNHQVWAEQDVTETREQQKVKLVKFNSVRIMVNNL